LRRDTAFELNPHVVNSDFIYDEQKRSALATIFKEYLDVGVKYHLPLVLSTPTWRASEQRIAEAGYAQKDVNGDNYRFLDDLRQDYGDYASQVLICGLMSCRGDAYSPAEALSTTEAEDFHGWQAHRLARSGVDFLLAATLPAYTEALGLASAMAATGTPYIVSFVLRSEGTLLDGTPLKEAIAGIDKTASPKPLAFMGNCTHATFFKAALTHPDNASDMVRERMVGLFANTAASTPEELNNCDALVEEDPVIFGESVAELHRSLGMKILGGCCGTDRRHIDQLARQLASGG
jgi:S-methylmethionine-dependent homocysteine/selenocysteine methylase